MVYPKVLDNKEITDYIDLDPINYRLSLLLGFSEFSYDDMYRYLIDDELFYLEFKKVKGQGYLYGLELARLRQALFNQLPPDIRLRSFLAKLNASGFDFPISLWDNVCFSNNIKNVTDIGMGHSVYCVELDNGESVVLKKVLSQNALFYSKLLESCDLPFIKIKIVQTAVGLWQFSDYCKGKQLTGYLKEDELSEQDIVQLAQQACIGDVFGRGDRHFENYIISDNIIYPVDIAYLFWPDNETWVNRYVAGGQSEPCVLRQYPNFEKTYWAVYNDTFNYLYENITQIKNIIFSFFPKKVASDYAVFVCDRLSNKDYVALRKESVNTHLEIYSQRYIFKEKLEKAMDRLNYIDNDLLRMYYYSNLNRSTAFFLIDYFNREDLFQLIL